MRVNEVADGVWWVGARATNAVLVTEGRSVTVIDTGYPRDRRLLTAALERTGRTVADVDGVVLTHAHVDHLGNARWFHETHGTPVHCHEDEVPHAVGDVIHQISERDLVTRAWRPGVARFIATAVASGALWARRPRSVTAFPDGATLDLPGRPVAVHTPGHTRGHVALHLPDRGALVAGDALITVDLWDGTDRGAQHIHPAFDLDPDQARRSLDRLVPLDAEVVVTGHGRPYRGTPAQAVAEARQRAR